jgi:hypothetical protein
MKSKFIYSALIAFVILAVAAPILMSSTDNETLTERLVGSAANYYLYPSSATGFTSDTITNAENDTLNLGSNLVSRWSYNWHINSTQLSGTESIIAIVQETNNASSSQTTPTDWIEVARDTLTANEDLRITGEVVYGIKQRLILDGSGTQSSTYSVKFAGKKW